MESLPAGRMRVVTCEWGERGIVARGPHACRVCEGGGASMESLPGQAVCGCDCVS